MRRTKVGPAQLGFLLGESLPGLTQEEAARRLGKPQSFVSKCESGERRVDFVELLAFVDLYGSSVEYFEPS